MILGVYCSTTNKCKHFIQEDNQVHSEGTIIYEQVSSPDAHDSHFCYIKFSLLAHTKGLMGLNTQS